MNVFTILIISLIVCLLLLFLSNRYLKYKNGNFMKVHENAIYNGKDTNPPLSTFNTIGFNLYGNFRADINGSTVKYLFFCIFFPLFPVGCYRAAEGATQFLGRQGASHVRKTKYTIYGTEKWNIVEVLVIYLITISIIIACLVIFFAWDYIF